jgi:hypothetical protein
MEIVGLGLMVILVTIKIGKMVRIIYLKKIIKSLGYPTSDNTKNCVSFDTTSGTWSNEDCDSFHCYICQKYV